MNNLNLPQVAPNQASKELTINDQALALDAAITESLALDASTGDRVVTLKEFTRNVLFTVTAASNGAEIIVPEGVYRMFALRNRSANGIVLKSGSMTFPIPAGGGGIYHTSETVLQAVVSGATSDHDSIGEAPNDGELYGRKNEGWEKVPDAPEPGAKIRVVSVGLSQDELFGTSDRPLLDFPFGVLLDGVASGVWDDVVNPSRLTVPAGYTHARVAGAMGFVAGSAPTAGSFQLTVWKNGADFMFAPKYMSTATYNNLGPSIASGLFPVQVGDYFQMRWSQTSTGNKTLDMNGTFFTIELYNL